ncbi:MAG: hypothetical protein AAGA90_24030 [Actinomycetota bacterium]
MTTRSSTRSTEHTVIARHRTYPRLVITRHGLAELLRELADEIDPGVSDNGEVPVLDAPFEDPDPIITDTVSLRLLVDAERADRGTFNAELSFATTLRKSTR